MFELSPEDFADAFKTLFQKEKSDKLFTLMQSLPNIQDCLEEVSFEKIVYSVKEQTFNLGETILHEGCSSDRLYIVKEGEVAIQRKITHEFLLELKRMKIVPENLRPFRGVLEEFYKAVLESKSVAKKFCLSIAKPGEALGVEAVIGSNLKSQFTYVASTEPTVIYYIKKDDFNRFFRLTEHSAINIYNSINNLRLRSLMQRIEKIVNVGTSPPLTQNNLRTRTPHHCSQGPQTRSVFSHSAGTRTCSDLSTRGDRADRGWTDSSSSIWPTKPILTVWKV